MDDEIILKWAAGSEKPLPAKLDFDEEILIDLVDSHNLSGRLMEKLENYESPFFTPKFRDSLRLLHAETRQKVIRNISVYRQIKKQLPTTELIIIKGVSTYVLTGYDGVMRAGDIDILSSDTSGLEETLLKMSYQQTRKPFLHEIGEYTKGTVEIDIHGYFPIYFYTKSLLRANLSPARNPNIWLQNYAMKQSKLTFETLSKHSYLGKMPETQDIRVADPNILALIICAHAFMNYTNMWSISHREKAYIRLGEIADLFELVKHSSFNRNTFSSLVKRFNAKDAVEWAANFATILIGENPLPISTPIFSDEEVLFRRFPRCLWWNFWISSKSETDCLIQKWWFPMDQLVEDFGFNLLTLKGEGRTETHSTVQLEEYRLLGHYITLKKYPILFILEIAVNKNDFLVRIKVKIDEISDIYRIRVDFGHIASEWVYSSLEQRQTLIGNKVNVKLKREGEYYIVNLKYSWETLERKIQNTCKLPLFIGVAKQLKNNDLLDSTLIPLAVFLDK